MFKNKKLNVQQRSLDSLVNNKISEAMYKQSQQSENTGDEANDSGEKNTKKQKDKNEVKDADYEVVDDEKSK